MPAYKALYIKEAIDSVLNQTFTDFELVIVNDASPEDIEEVVKSYDDTRIRYYVNEKNIGGQDLVAQWNRCLSYARGEYVIVATDDDIYLPMFLQKMNDLVDRYPGVDAFRPRVEKLKGNEVIDSDGFLPEFLSQYRFLYFYFKRVVCPGIGFWVFRKSALKRIGGFPFTPAAWFADDVLIMRLSDNGVGFCNELLYRFRAHDSSITYKRNDSKLLAQKLKAHEMFCLECNRMFNNDEVNEDGISNQQIRQLTFRISNGLWYWDIVTSDKKAVIHNLKPIFSAGKLSKFGMAKYILNFMIK